MSDTKAAGDEESGQEAVEKGSRAAEKGSREAEKGSTHNARTYSDNDGDGFIGLGTTPDAQACWTTTRVLLMTSVPNARTRKTTTETAS